MRRIFVYPLVLSSLLTVSHTASAVLTEDIATDELINRLTLSPSQVVVALLPSDPVQSLIDAVNQHSAALGFSVDHGPSIRESEIPNEFAGRVALLVQAAINCQLATNIDLKRDCAAKDRYREGPPGRINGATLVEPQTACFAAPGLGVFADE